MGFLEYAARLADAFIAFTGLWKYNDFRAQSLDEFTMECNPLEDVNPAADESGFLCKDDCQVFLLSREL